MASIVLTFLFLYVTYFIITSEFGFYLLSFSLGVTLFILADDIMYSTEGGTWNELLNGWEWKDDDGFLHRDCDLPARIRKSFNKRTIYDWYKHGVPHRENGPASIIYKDGRLFQEFWYFNGKQHRLGGPTMVRIGDRERSGDYYVDGKMFKDGTTDEYREACRRFRIEHDLLEPGKLTKPARPAHTRTNP